MASHRVFWIQLRPYLELALKLSVHTVFAYSIIVLGDARGRSKCNFCWHACMFWVPRRSPSKVKQKLNLIMLNTL